MREQRVSLMQQPTVDELSPPPGAVAVAHTDALELWHLMNQVRQELSVFWMLCNSRGLESREAQAAWRKLAEAVFALPGGQQ